MKKIIIIFVLAIFIFPTITMADGGLVPPPNRYVYETDQKAVIFFEDNTETLVVSTKFQGDAENFAWIIPTPSQPIVEKSTVELFNSLAELTEVMKGAPRGLSETGLGIMMDTAVQQVEVIETKQIEYYDITVLKASDEHALNDWLNEHGYNFPSTANYVLDHYIENDWYFTAVKISGEYLSGNLNQATRNGDLIPLSLEFSTDKIVFPLKISSVDYYYEEDVKPDLAIYNNRYKPVFDYLITEPAIDPNLYVFLPPTWVDNDAIIISSIIQTMRLKLKEELQYGKTYSESVASVANFISKPEYDQMLYEYQNAPSPEAEVFEIIQDLAPEIEQDIQSLNKIYLDNSNSLKKAYNPRSNPYIELSIYIIADKVYEYSNFLIQYADLIEKDDIENLASKDDGGPWLEPKEKKYALTRLYKNMRQSEMTNDIYFKKSDMELSDLGPKSTTGFYIFIIIAVLITLSLGITIIFIYRKK